MTSSNTFNPTAITVAKGTTVTWGNSTGVTHNVGFSAGSGAVAIGDYSSGNRTAKFDVAGSFFYFCSIHAGMGGQITVNP